MTPLRIFSYLPNPRVFKALIAAELCNVPLEVVGDRPASLAGWLWDYDARELSADEQTPQSAHARISQRGFKGTLYKTDAFLRSQPFGTVPCAFSPGGKVGIFESNSILRAVVRQAEQPHSLYGTDAYSASRIDSFLDASLVFAREAQVYLLAISDMQQETCTRMASAYEFYLQGVENALQHTSHLADDYLSIADIAFVCDLAQFLREAHYTEALHQSGFTVISAEALQQYPLALTHMLALSETAPFRKHMGSYLDWYKREHNL
ncbi:MAG: glutathione S-transferase family protein [bacterium]